MKPEAAKLFSIPDVKADMDARVTPSENIPSELDRKMDDRVTAVRAVWQNGYFNSIVNDLRAARTQLRSKLSSGSGESIGRFQAVDELLERLENEKERFSGKN